MPAKVVRSQTRLSSWPTWTMFCVRSCSPAMSW